MSKRIKKNKQQDIKNALFKSEKAIIDAIALKCKTDSKNVHILKQVYKTHIATIVLAGVLGKQRRFIVFKLPKEIIEVVQLYN